MSESGNGDEQRQYRDTRTFQSKRWAPLIIALGYLLVGTLWILFSDRALATIAQRPTTYARWQTYKGWGYVVVTASLLFGVLRLFANGWQHVENALRASEEKYRLHFENVSDVIYSIDRDLRILSISPSVKDVLGYEPEALIGTSIQEIDLMTPTSKRAAIEDTRQVLARGRMEPAIYEFIAKDGTKKLGEVSGSPLIHEGKVVSVVSVARDVTERVEMERQLRRQERLAVVGKLAAGIAHDFRNLLTTISLYAEMALREPAMSRDVARKLRIIIGESHKAADLVHSIIDFGAQVAINAGPLALNDHVREVVDVLRRTIPENVRISVTSDADPVVVKADPGRIQQVLTNLALNARDAMPDGGELTFGISHLSLHENEPPPVADMNPGAWACLTVKDTGTGMTDEVKAHLFEPFFTTKEAGQGTGLGLAQVYGIVVHQHGGAIHVESEVEEGTAVTLYLPVTRDVQAELMRSHQHPEVPQGRGETIVLVEDQDKLRAAVSGLLRSLGYEVWEASDGAEALRMYRASWQERGIDLIVSDVVMPEMSGQDLARALKEINPRVRLIAITGYPSGEIMAELTAVGFLDVVGKPLDTDTFARAVRNALDTRSPGRPQSG